MDKYILELNNSSELKEIGSKNKELLDNLREYAKQNSVPIITRESLCLINSIISLKRYKTMLEVGCAIGYSSLSFAMNNEDLHIDTIERNIDMYNEAIKNISLSNIDRINVIFDDALLIDNSKLAKYDIIFIDAAKAQYTKFFEKFYPLLNDGGVIISDNILFHGCVENKNLDNLSKNVKNMAKKIDSYNHYLNTLESFKTTFLSIGDGLAISVKK